MSESSRLKRSIGLTQAVGVLVAALVIGLGLSAVQLAQTFGQQRHEALLRAAEILSLAEGGATGAVWTLDPELAQDVVTSMMMADGVEAATLEDEYGMVLASRKAVVAPTGALAGWFADVLLPESLAASKALEVTVDGELQPVGFLSVWIASAYVANGFVSLASGTVAVSVVTALLVALVLLALSSHLVTTPLRQVTSRIAGLDPEHPEDFVLEAPPGHRDNELGELIERTNQTVRRLASTQKELRRLATRDSLTDLPNREVIGDRLRKAIARARRRGRRLAVLFLDLDRFKTINDSLGHDTGDKLLTAVAKVLSETVRAEDSIGRLGGDEFVVLIEDLPDSEEAMLGVQRIVDALSRPFLVDQREVRTTASVGIALFPDDGGDGQTLMRHADLAMYRAKQAGGGGWRFFAPEMSERVDERLRAEMALAAALDRGELAVVYQAKVAARSGRLAGCEALLRWDLDGERLDAQSFIAVAEDTGLILEIGRWVLDEVCRQIGAWCAQGFRVAVAVNVSARQLMDPNFVGTVFDAVDRHGIDSSLLQLEITETVLMEDPAHSAKLLRVLARRDVRISIDDFGTGYSSLAYLTQLPVQSLKIDRSFVEDEESSSAILETIIAMARALGLETIAEGIESEEERVRLLDRGCDVLQGYRIGRPMDALAFERCHLANPQTNVLDYKARRQ